MYNLTYSNKNVYILFQNMCLRPICAESPGTERTGSWFRFKLFIKIQRDENFRRPQYCHCGNFLMLLQQKRLRGEVQHCVDSDSVMTGRLSNFPYKTCNLQDIL
jgi:hypothetical protein